MTIKMQSLKPMNILRGVLLAKFLTMGFLSLISSSAFAAEYQVECRYAGCSDIINGKLSEKFKTKYPANEWKIVAPNSHVFRYGNGSLRGYFQIAVAPKNYLGTEADYPAYLKKLKTTFFSAKEPPDFDALGYPYKTMNMYDQKNFDEAGFAVMAIMIKEATDKMMAQCDADQNCNLYSP